MLEGFLNAASSRAAVRAYCVGLLATTPETLRARLGAVAEYVGGKCMGYPAVWFLERILQEEPEAIVERCRAPLCLSLSTSIVDDLADGDEPLGPEYLAYLYILIGQAASTGCGADTLARLHRAIETCLDPKPAANAHVAERRGDRIGAFFAMIAETAVAQRLPSARALIAIEATARFGEICAHIDDWMDAQRDLYRGATENIALTLLREKLDFMPVQSTDLALHGAWLDTRMHVLLATRIQHAIALADSAGFAQASRALAALLHSA